MKIKKRLNTLSDFKLVTYDLMSNPFKRCVFVRKIDLNIDHEYNPSLFNYLFNMIFENRNLRHKYEILRFDLDDNGNIINLDRVVLGNLPNSYNETCNSRKTPVSVNNDDELCFKERNYEYQSLHFNSTLLNLTLLRTNTLTNKIDKLNYKILVL